MSVKSEKFCPAPPTLSVDLVGCLKLLGVYKRATGPKDMFYKAVELASSFSDLQKLTFFGCASRLEVRHDLISAVAESRSRRTAHLALIMLKTGRFNRAPRLLVRPFF